MSAAVVWTAVELARLFRARDCYVIGYIGEWDEHDAHDGTRHMCHLISHPTLPPLPRGSALRFLGLRS